MLRRLTPALVLVLLAPFIGEVLLGNTPLHMIAVYLVELPMYGCGALFIREAARRTGRGWPTILALGAAYGVAEEGFGDMTLFNPHYLGLHLLQQGNHWGIGWVWWLHVIALHMVWSIGTSIALTEALFARRATTPWLGRAGFVITGVVFVLGTALVHFGSSTKYHYELTQRQAIITGALIAALALVAFLFPRSGNRPRAARSAEPTTVTPTQAGTFSLLASGAFLAVNQFLPRSLDARIPIAADLVLFLLAVLVIGRWSRRPGWRSEHRLALAVGTTLSYCWFGLVHVPHDRADLLGQAAFALFAVLLLLLTLHTVHAFRRRSPRPRLTRYA